MTHSAYVNFKKIWIPSPERGELTLWSCMDGECAENASDMYCRKVLLVIFGPFLLFIIVLGVFHATIALIFGLFGH
jgi:hypothetical protein